jgi:hypothetical protein
MPNVKNLAYYGTTGTIVIGGDTHFGVTSCGLVPTTASESVTDISGDVQGSVGAPQWELQLTFHQDHKTPNSLSRRSIEWHGQKKSVTYTPQAGGDAITVEVTFKAADVGGDTGRHSATLALPVNGQPSFVAPGA